MALSKDDIERMEREGDVKGLIDALKKGRSSRIDASIALSKMKDVKAVDPVIQLLNDEDPEVRFSAAIILGEIGDKKAVEPLIQALEDTKARAIAAQALGKIGDVKAVEPLILALKIDASNLVRGAAARALGEIGDMRAVEPLTQALSDPDRYARLVAHEVLEKLKKQ